MIDIEKQRAECARMEAMLAEFNDGYEFRTTKDHFDFVAIARTDWPALIKAHREACDEIDRLRQVNAAYLESHLSGMDLAQQREQEIERLRADLLRENSAAETHRQECVRLQAAGKVLAAFFREHETDSAGAFGKPEEYAAAQMFEGADGQG